MKIDQSEIVLQDNSRKLPFAAIEYNCCLVTNVRN